MQQTGMSNYIVKVHLNLRQDAVKSATVTVTVSGLSTRILIYCLPGHSF